MKNLIFAILLMLPIGSAMADYVVSDSGLTDEQVAQLQLQAAQMKAQNKTATPKATAKQVTEWVQVGTAIGQGLSGTAKELGVAADQIADTKVGFFAMILIAWTYIGHDVVGIVFGTVWLLLAVPTWLWAYRRMFMIAEINTWQIAKGETGKKKQIVYSNTRSDQEMTHFLFFIALLLIVATGVLAIF